MIQRGEIQRPKYRLIAFYLPQFHPIPENDAWWGPGFTEWTNVAKARPLFRGHYQPRLPADLGFYDLRVPEVRQAQATLARRAGVEGFCYYHYWFGGRRLLERPFNEVLESGEPDFPFCLAWANQTWSGVWHGAPNRILVAQTYPGREDNQRHFDAVLPAFKDPRYIRVHDEPLFMIYRPRELPDVFAFIQQWQKLARDNGLKGIYFVAHVLTSEQDADYTRLGFAGINVVPSLKAPSIRAAPLSPLHADPSLWGKPVNHPSEEAWRSLQRRARYARRKVMAKLTGKSLSVVDYRDAMLMFLDGIQCIPRCFPCLIPNWDNSPRSGVRGFILHDSTPDLFRTHVKQTLGVVNARELEDRIVFVKSWNEWAEGNYLEPDARFGHQYLDVLREQVFTSAGGSGGVSGSADQTSSEQAVAAPVICGSEISS
jgi:lipopolysaccharide biosynthesis protein